MIFQPHHHCRNSNFNFNLINHYLFRPQPFSHLPSSFNFPLPFPLPFSISIHQKQRSGQIFPLPLSLSAVSLSTQSHCSYLLFPPFLSLYLFLPPSLPFSLPSSPPPLTLFICYAQRSSSICKSAINSSISIVRR